MNEPQLPALPPMPTGDPWNEHVERFFKMTESERLAYWQTLTEQQRVDFNAASDRYKARLMEKQTSAASVSNNKGAAVCVALGVLAGLFVNVLVGGFFLLLALVLYIQQRKAEG